MENLLSEKENIRLTDEVLRYHAMEEGDEKAELGRKLLERTELLTYLIPIERGFLSREDAGAFYLSQKNLVWKMMDAYRVSQLPYITYLTQILRRRCVTHLIKERQSSSDRARLDYEESRENLGTTVKDAEVIYSAAPRTGIWQDEDEWIRHCDEERYRVPMNPPRPRKPFERMDIKELVQYIRNAGDGDGTELTAQGEQPMKEALRNSRNRDGLIELLLWTADEGNDGLFEHLSRVLNVPEDAIARLFFLKNEICRPDRERIMKNKDIANRHFRAMLKLNTAWYFAEDSAAKESIMEHTDRVRKAYNNRLNLIKRASHGLTQREISEIMGISRSLVSIHISRAREMLRDTLDTVLLQTEGSDDKLIV